jgi:hypothetical protein
MNTSATSPLDERNKVIVLQKPVGRMQLRERIGSTTYEVSIHFSETSKESMEDKILRLVEGEARNAA